MARSILKDPDEVARAILFGTKLHPVNVEELSRRTGISRSTLNGYKKEPQKIPLGRLSTIVKKRGLGEKEITDLFRVYGRKL